MNVVVAPDSWKGSLTAVEAAETIASALVAAGPHRVQQQPLADGGEGTASVLAAALAADWRPCVVPGPLPTQQVEAGFMWSPHRRIAVMDLASAAGLPLVPANKRDPLRTSTVGVGTLIQHALEVGASEIFVGAGGSATVDCGFGMAQTLGWRFLDDQDRVLEPCGGNLSDIRMILPPEEFSLNATLSILCDVDSVLCGPEGCVRLYASQKGADAATLDRLELGVDASATLLEAETGLAVRTLVGGGAAGGFAAGAAALLGARLERGIDVVCDLVRFQDSLQHADWVVTGEGRLDHQSLRGKVVSGVLERARIAGVPVAVVAGQIDLEPGALADSGIAVAVSMADLAGSVAQSMAQPLQYLSEAATCLARSWGRNQ